MRLQEGTQPAASPGTQSGSNPRWRATSPGLFAATRRGVEHQAAQIEHEQKHGHISLPHKSGYAACTGVLRESISMKPDVKKIIADIKATKGNRKFCNGLAGTLQDDNYASSICKYVKTVTPERIDLLIEYAEKLEAEVTDMAVQLANAESKCMDLAAELSAVDKIHNEAVFITDDHYEQCPPEVQKIIRSLAVLQISACNAFLAEVRASTIDNLVSIKTKQLADMHPDTHAFGANAMSIRSQINELQMFAAQLRKGAAQ